LAATGRAKKESRRYSLAGTREAAKAGQLKNARDELKIKEEAGESKERYNIAERERNKGKRERLLT